MRRERQRGSASGQMQKITAGKFHFEPPFTSLDHFVGAAEQRDWKSDAERMGGLEIDDQLGFCGLLHREVGRLLAFEDASGIAASETVPVRNTASVAHQAAGSSERAILVDRRYRVADRQGTVRFGY